MNNSLVVLAVIVSLATLVMLGINLYMMMQVKKERKKNFIMKQNIGTLSIVIHKKIDQVKTSTVLTSSSQTPDYNAFLGIIERDLDQINRID